MERNEALAPFPDTATVGENGHLYIGGVDTVDLAASWGTPLYVYDEATIRARCRAYTRALRAHYAGSSAVRYASKAYLCTAVAQLIAEEGLGLDVVSGGELYIALRAGVPADRVHVHGSNKSKEELALAIENGVSRIAVDNAREMALLDALAAGRGGRVGIWLRVSPNVDAHTHAYNTTGLLDSKFGFSLVTGEAHRAIEAVQRSRHLELKGLHAHIGSQIHSAAPFVEAVDALLDLAAGARAMGLTVEELSPGGGLGIPYGPLERGLSIGALVRAIAARVEAGCATRQLPLPRLVLEPGRSIIGQAGVALYAVGGVKAIPGVRTYVSVDGGMADNPRPALYGAAYTGLLANRAAEAPRAPVTVAGKLCESGDILIRDLPLPPPRPGDLLAVPASGAYQLAMSSNYNQFLRPAAVLVAGGTAQLIQRRETYEDLVRRDLPLLHAE